MSNPQAALPSVPFRVVCAIAVLNSDGSVKDWLTDILAGGTVTIDTTSEVSRTCQFQCLDPAGLLTPVWPDGGLLDPLGVEVKIYAGYDVDNVPALYPQGVFWLQETDVATGTGSTTAPGPVLTVTGSDRAARISANAFLDVYSIPAGTSVAQAIMDILSAQAPWIGNAYSITPSTSVVAAQTFQPGDDPWAAIQAVAATAGQLAYFDAEGILQVINDPSSNPKQPAATMVDGLGNPCVSVTRTTSRTPGYNGVIIIGQSATNSTAVISGSAFDEDPNSPTYYLGPYGQVPAPPVQVSTVTTDADAAAMAKSLLPQVLGLTRQIVVDVVPLFWLDTFDLFRVQNRTTQTDSVVILEQATIPLDYSQLESLTGVPLGTNISQFDGLSNQPSVGAYAPVSNGSFAFNPTTGTYTWQSYGTTGGASALSPGTFALGGLFGLGVFGGGAQLAYPNGLLRRIIAGTGGVSVKRDATDGVTDVEGFALEGL